MKDIDFECWFCGAVFDRPHVEAESLLVPRVRRDGGPFLLYTCSGCERKSRIERNRAGAFLAGPIPIVPVIDAVMATFDAELRRNLVHKKEFLKRREGRRTWFFEVYEQELMSAGVKRGRPEPVPEPEPPPKSKRAKPKRPKNPKRERPPPAPEPPPRPEVEIEPTAWEILGLDPGAEAPAISTAFKELAKRYHPDRFEALDEEFKALAHKKFVQLKAAHDELLDA